MQASRRLACLHVHNVCTLHTHAQSHRAPRAQKPLLIPPPPTTPRLAEFQMVARVTAGSFADGIRLPIRCYLIVAPAHPIQAPPNNPSCTQPHSRTQAHCTPACLASTPAPGLRTARSLPTHHTPASSPCHPLHPLNRRAVLHNLRYDDTLMQLHNASGAGTNASLYLTGSDAQAARLAAGGACTTLSFRTGPVCCCTALRLLVCWWGVGSTPRWSVLRRRRRCRSVAQHRMHTCTARGCKGPFACEEACHPGAVPRRVAGRLLTQARTYPAAPLARPPTPRRHHAACAPFRGGLLHG